MDELNPNHPVTSKMHDQWHKIVALLMMIRDETEIEISLADIERSLDGEMKAVVIHDTGHSLVLRLVSMDEAKKLAREAGGLLV